MKRKTFVAAFMALCPLSLFAQFAWQPVQAETKVVEKGNAIEKIVSHEKVGDWGTVVESIDVTVKDKKLIKKLKASDFDITNNVYNTMYDPETGETCQDFKDDQITLTKNGNVLTITAKPFDAAGKRNQRWQKEPWQVICKKSDALSFSGKDVDEKTIGVIDECIRGSHTFAGITREYMLYLPKDENGNVIKNVPLFVWQIGGGEYNQDIMTVALANKCLAALPDHGEKVATLVFALANPNYSYSASLDPEKIKLVDRNNALQMNFIDTLIKDGTVDGSKLFCAGASSGGGCTMRFMMQFADRFKAAIPICAMDPIVPIHQVKDLDEVKLKNDLEAAFQGNVYKWNGSDMVLQPMNTQAFVKLPMYFAHAKDDTTCKVISTEAYYEVRARLGAKDDKKVIYSDAEMKEYGFGGMLAHFSWCRVLDDFNPGSPMDWLIKQF